MIQRVILASSFFGTRQGVGRNHFRPSELLVGTTSDQAGCRSEPLPARQGAGRNHFRPGRVPVGTTSGQARCWSEPLPTRQGAGRNPFRPGKVPAGTLRGRKGSDQYLAQSEVVSFFVVPGEQWSKGGRSEAKSCQLPTKEFPSQPYE